MTKKNISDNPIIFSTVGSILKKARIKKGFSLEDIADSLNVDIKYLVMIEEDNFKSFSAPVFIKGYIRSYALKLGLESERLLDKYLEQTGSDDPPDLISTDKILSLSTYSNPNFKYYLLFLGILFVVLIIFYFYSSFQGRSIQSVEENNKSIIEMKESEQNQIIEDNQLSEEDNLEYLDQLILSNLSDNIEDDSLLLPSEIETTDMLLDQQIILDDFSIAQENESSIVNIDILYIEDCWVEVYDGNNTRLLYYLGRAGEEVSLEAVAPVSFLLGNYEGVRVLIDDVTYFIPGGARRGNVAQFSVLDEIEESND